MLCPIRWIASLPQFPSEWSAWMFSGLRASLSGERASRREGQILEHPTSGSGRSCEDCTPLREAPQVLTGRLWFSRDYGRSLRRRPVGLVVCRSSFFGEGEITLSTCKGSAVEKLGFWKTLHGITKAVEMSCDMTTRVGRL
jgi:hypothetical protein